MDDFQLILRVPIKAIDIPAARQIAKEILSKVTLPDNTETKLQKVFNNKPPEKIEI